MTLWKCFVSFKLPFLRHFTHSLYFFINFPLFFELSISCIHNFLIVEKTPRSLDAIFTRNFPLPPQKNHIFLLLYKDEGTHRSRGIHRYWNPDQAGWCWKKRLHRRASSRSALFPCVSQWQSSRNNETTLELQTKRRMREH